MTVSASLILRVVGYFFSTIRLGVGKENARSGAGKLEAPGDALTIASHLKCSTETAMPPSISETPVEPMKIAAGYFLRWKYVQSASVDLFYACRGNME